LRNFFSLNPLHLLQHLLQLQALLPSHRAMSIDDPNATNRPLSAQLPPLQGSLSQVTASGQTLRVEGTNVVRVPFGVRRAQRVRPARPERWATVVLPFQLGGSTPPPPQAA
jgi:hypothetical protein